MAAPSRRRRGAALTRGPSRGYFPAPTVVTGLPTTHRLFKDELFVPFAGRRRGRLARRGADAGEPDRVRPDGRHLQRGRAEIRRFLDAIQAGVIYVNRRAGATTGAWPGIQSFGGWKGSAHRARAGWAVLRPAVHARAVADHHRRAAGTMSTNGRGPTEIQIEIEEDEDDALETTVDSSGWFSVQLRYAYLVGVGRCAVPRRGPRRAGRRRGRGGGAGPGFEIAAEYEDDFETDEGEAGIIRFEGIVAIKELDDRTRGGHRGLARVHVARPASRPMPTASRCRPSAPLEMAFPRAHDD